MLCLCPSPTTSLCLVNATLGSVCSVEASTSSPMQVTQSHSNTLKAWVWFFSLQIRLLEMNHLPGSKWVVAHSVLCYWGRAKERMNSCWGRGELACNHHVVDTDACKKLKIITISLETSAYLFVGATQNWWKETKSTSEVARQLPTLLIADYSSAQQGGDPKNLKPRYQVPLMRQTVTLSAAGAQVVACWQSCAFLFACSQGRRRDESVYFLFSWVEEQRLCWEVYKSWCWCDLLLFGRCSTLQVPMNRCLHWSPGGLLSLTNPPKTWRVC